MLSIPKPCHEDWGQMSPEERGRHCSVCCKVVVDFTLMPTEKVVDYISERKDQKICGRFRSDQVSVPEFPEKNKSYTGRIKLFLAALVFVFGATLFNGCKIFPHHKEKEVMGIMVDPHTPDSIQNNFIPKPVLDTPQKDNHPKGEVICTHPPKTDTTKEEIMGKVQYVPK
ncbi:MAG: hypothetical protein HY064_05310 [Bacteroidetes bacterium]|nr:hypothetical protein [Bacteroidota bacterium]